MRWCTRIVGFYLCLLVIALGLSLSWTARPPKLGSRSALRTDDPAALLAEANRLSWLGNWYTAGPLYKQAESRFHAMGDTKNETYARLGRIRSQAASTPLDQTLAAFGEQLNSAAVMEHPRLRMWCLALRGSIRIDRDTTAAKHDWTAALAIANGLGESQWAARAKGELGVIAFLEGKTAPAVSLIGGAILSAYRTGDKASQVRLLAMLGLGFNEEHRFSEALTMFSRAIATAEGTADAGFPFLAYRGKAAALAGLHQTGPARQLLTKALGAARAQNGPIYEADFLFEAAKVEIADQTSKEAEADFRDAGRIAERMQDYRTVSDVMFDLSAVERELGGHAKR